MRAAAQAFDFWEDVGKARWDSRAGNDEACAADSQHMASGADRHIFIHPQSITVLRRVK